MLFEAIDHLNFCPTDPQKMIQAVTQVGWRMTPWREGWSISFGADSNLFQVWVQSTTNSETGVREFGLRVKNIERVVARLSERGVFGHIVSWRNNTGEKIADVALLSTLHQAGVNLRLIEWTPARVTPAKQKPCPVAAKRLDHLAIITHDLAVKSTFWEEVLGVPKHGMVSTPNMIIHQYRIGDAIIELLGPTTAESTLMKRTPGPAPMFSIEVSNLAETVQAVGQLGLPAPAPADGVLPMTITSTIPFEATGGLNWQLLQYV